MENRMSFKRAVFNAKKALFLRSSHTMYRQLLRNERLAPDQVIANQAERAISHARFAMGSTRFYRDFYRDAGFRLEDLNDPSVFTDLPVVEKSHVRERFADFRSTEATERNSRVSTTGGSTGEPLKILRDLRTPTRTLEWRLFTWWGVDPSDDVAIVYRQLRTAKAKNVHDLQWWPSRRFQLDAFQMNDARIASFFAQWDRIRPALLIGYVGGVVELAAQLERSGREINPPRAVAVTAAPVTPAQRHTIEAAFAAPVYDHYRSAEVPWIAGECAAHQGLHTFADVRVVEVLDESDRPVAPGVMGEVVATDLTNRVFPLVRYRLGDRTSPLAGECPCGVTLPRIQPVAGRVSDLVRLPDGQVVPGESLTQTFRSAVDAVRQFQIHQSADFSITVRCVPSSGQATNGTIEDAVAKVRGIVMDKVPVRLEIVDSIAHVGGKIRYITSDVEPTRSG
jgi:phenylacetate-CoA ligase